MEFLLFHADVFLYTTVCLANCSCFDLFIFADFHFVMFLYFYAI